MPKTNGKPLLVTLPEAVLPPADWRAEAEAEGRKAFEAATTEPEPTPEPALAWLWTPKRKEPPNVA